jgi:SnoaL-like domain
MNAESFQAWLDSYRSAWEARDPQAAQALFAEGATYQETPFDEPLRGREAVFAYWAEAPRTQDQVRFKGEVLAVSERGGVARWQASFVRVPSGVRVELDGIFLVQLDQENRCREFQEWWHRREHEPIQSEPVGTENIIRAVLCTNFPR